MPKKKYTTAERERLGIKSAKKKKRSLSEQHRLLMERLEEIDEELEELEEEESRVIYDDEHRPRQSANLNAASEEDSDGMGTWLLAGLVVIGLVIWFM